MGWETQLTTGASSMVDPGDFGRRVASRRNELGLTHEDVAHRTGMDANYLVHLETHPTAMPDSSVLFKLARALDTTVALLLGTGHRRPPGSARTGADASLVSLNEDECWNLIAHGGVGRVLFDNERGPIALPVNFRALPPRQVVFRTDPNGSVGRLPEGAHVGFEVDRIDDAFSTGWSVMLSGRVRIVTEPKELDALSQMGVEPWAGGNRSRYLVIEANQATGRRIERPR